MTATTGNHRGGFQLSFSGKLSELIENYIVCPEFKIITLYCDIQIEEIFVSFWLAKSSLRTRSSEVQLLFTVLADIQQICRD